MPPLCAQTSHNPLLRRRFRRRRHPSAMSSAASALPDPSLLSIAHNLFHPNHHHHHNKLPTDFDLSSPWPPPSSSSSPDHHHHHHTFEPSPPPPDAADLAALLLRGGGGGVGAAELDIPSDWMSMDCFMYDLDGDAVAIASCFDANPCESSTQSSEPAAMAGASSGYPCTPLEEALPDGFTVLEEAQRCMQQETPWQQQQKQKQQQHGDHQRQDMVMAAHVELHLQEEEQAMSSGATSRRDAGERCRSQLPENAACVSSNGIHLMQMLLECARAVDRHPERATLLLSALELQASVDGDPIQRLSAYFAHGLRRRIRQNAGEFHLLSTTTAQERLMAHKAIRDTCPFDAFAELTANQSILECAAAAAPPASARLHIVDFGLGYGVQWAALLQSMADGGSSRALPSLQITAVRMPGGPETSPPVGFWLAEFGRSAGVRVGFKAAEAEMGSIGIEEGDVVVVNLMHSLSAAMERGGEEGVQKLLGLVAEMEPRLVMAAEMEAAAPAPAGEEEAFEGRFVAALQFYAAMFDAAEAAMGREKERREMVEAVILGKGVAEAVAGRGGGGGGNWLRRRLSSAGLAPKGLSSYARSQARILLWRFADGFGLLDDVEDDDGASVTLAWQRTPLLTVSAWWYPILHKSINN